MKIGTLGDIAFQVSDKIVQTFQNMTWKGSANYAIHNRRLTNSLTEFVGIDPDSITLDIELSTYLGSDVMAELGKIWKYERTGEAVSLVVGGKGYGKYKWNLTGHTIKMRSFDKEGKLTRAVVSISLQEYLKN